MRVLIKAFLLVASSTSLLASYDVSFESLLDEMVDRDELAKLPEHPYQLGQASSYDRASKSPSEGWFANGDGGGYIRTETNQGRSERVLMDVEGPGAVVHFWSTNLTWAFSNGTLRFYFDGSDTPQVEGKFLDILMGNHLADGVLAEETGGFREDHQGKGYILGGKNLYLPIPYAKGCKVTYEGVDNPFYFIINYRSYAAGTAVKTFSMSELQTHAAKLAEVEKELVENSPVTVGSTPLRSENRTIAAGDSISCEISGERAIRQLMVNLEAENHSQALRSTVLEIEFDGMPKVWAPMGDFFCTGYQFGTGFEGRYHKLTLDGRMLSRWIMPFKKSAKLTIYNHGTQPITLKEFELHHSSWNWDARSLYFHADWRVYTKIPSHPRRDLNYITIQGKGKYVGDSLAIFNNSTNKEPQPWWGEGDEKIYIDGETFPSHFGTGTEDYYAYAWVGCVPFAQPFLCQPIAQGNRGRGLTVNSRWRSLDPIPFEKSLKLDMELWHWVNGIDVDYAPTCFWYGTADTRSETLPADRLTGVQTAVRVVDRLEAEGLQFEIKSSGVESVVYTRPNHRPWSNRSMLLLSSLKKGDEIDAHFYSGSARKGSLKIAAEKSPNYGTVDLLLNGKTLVSNFDLNGAGDGSIQIPDTAFLKGKNTLTIRATGTSPASNANGFAFDYLEMQ